PDAATRGPISSPNAIRYPRVRRRRRKAPCATATGRTTHHGWRRASPRRNRLPGGRLRAARRKRAGSQAARRPRVASAAGRRGRWRAWLPAAAAGHWPRRPAGCRPGARRAVSGRGSWQRSEEHTSELQSRENLVCRLLLEKKKKYIEYKKT